MTSLNSYSGRHQGVLFCRDQFACRGLRACWGSRQSQAVHSGGNIGMTLEAAGRNGFAGLQDELRYLLNRWDLMGIYDEQVDFPPGEYDCLIGPLLARLTRYDSRASLCEYLWHEIEDHFGLDPVRCGTGRPRGRTPSCPRALAKSRRFASWPGHQTP
jgi:hypothetical protein